MLIFYLILPAAIAAVTSWLLTPYTAAAARRLGAIDQPGPRKLHALPVPRLGGVAVIAAAVFAWSVLLIVPGFEETFPPDLAIAMFVGLVPIFIVGLLDDIRPVSAVIRLAVQCLSAVLVVTFGVHVYPDIHVFGLTVHIGWWSFPITVLWIVGVTNAFNLADGLDGLSAGLALISALSFAALGLITGGPTLAALPLVLVGAIGGFLPFNLYPARIFLGDCGATAIGFCLACLGLRSGSALTAGLAILVPVLVVGVPIADTLVAIARRTLRRNGTIGHSVITADRDHIHHRLLKHGFGHVRAVLFLYAIAAAVAVMGVASLFVTNSNAALLLGTLMAAGFIGVGRLGYEEFAVLRRGVILPLYDMPLVKLGLFRVFVDLALVALAFYGAYVLKYDDWYTTVDRELFINHLALMLPVTILTFSAFRLYQRSWRFASIGDVMGVAAAVTTAGAGSFVLGRLFVNEATSLSLVAIHTVLLLMLVSGARSSFRILAYWRQRSKPTARPALVYGAGVEGLNAVRELEANPGLNFRVAGYLDDDRTKAHRRIGGYPVLGRLADLEHVIADHGIETLVVASDTIDAERLRTAAEICERAGIDLVRFSLAVRLVSVPLPAQSDARWNVSSV
jgi:UDP-GlcNAc:undecaprenyl-phosphate GlcNAc-1-phosphate transferase